MNSLSNEKKKWEIVKQKPEPEAIAIILSIFFFGGRNGSVSFQRF